MTVFITNYFYTLLIGAIVFAALTSVVLKMIKDKKNHKSSCGCSCKSCPNGDICHK